jgi:tetratricopeptide (TPR) repeat protein
MNVSFPTPRPSPSASRWATFAIIMLLVGSVFGPLAWQVWQRGLVRQWWPHEQARWQLAAAANKIDLHPDDEQAQEQARQLLDRAKALHPAIILDPEYARLKLLAGPISLDQATEIVESAPRQWRWSLASTLAEVLSRKQRFGDAYEVLRLADKPLDQRDPAENNQFAYFSALADRDLEEGLTSIERALEDSQQKEEFIDRYRSSAFWDTKAWVLYRLRRFEEALAAIDRALADESAEREKLPGSPSEESLYEAFLEGKPPFVAGSNIMKNYPALESQPFLAGPIVASAIYRYHRAEILEGLERTEEAAAAYEWLKCRGFGDFSKLY